METQQTEPKKLGRPTKYKPEYAERDYMQGYFDECKEEEKLISICGYSCYIGVCEDTLYEWAKHNKPFSESLKIIKQMSKEMLSNNGLKSIYNSTITKLMLSHNHGMREGQDIKHSGEAIVIKLPDKVKDI